MRVAAANAFLYPDLLVECEPDADPSALYTSTPKLVVEVLSPTTRDFDRGDKFALYRRCPSLEEYVLVDSERRVVEPFHRREDGTWSIGERMADEGGGRAELCRPAPRHGHDLRGQRRAHGGSAQG